VLGVNGFGYRQLTGDSGSGDRVGPFKGSVDAIGPGLSYTTVIGKTPFIFNLRHYTEFNATNHWQLDDSVGHDPLLIARPLVGIGRLLSSRKSSQFFSTSRALSNELRTRSARRESFSESPIARCYRRLASSSEIRFNHIGGGWPRCAPRPRGLDLATEAVMRASGRVLEL
jgi:hypothetical protein